MGFKMKTERNVKRVCLLLLCAVVGRVCSEPTNEDSAAVTFERLWQEDKNVNKSSTFIRFLPTFLLSDTDRTGNDNDNNDGASNKEDAVKSGDLDEDTQTLKQMVIEKALGIKGRSAQKNGKLLDRLSYY